jgi:hypothetical protein
MFHDETGRRVALRVPSDVLASAPVWSQVDDPSLSISKALTIARQHAAAKSVSSSISLYEIVVKPVACTDGNRWYYVFRFGAASRGAEIRGWLTFAILHDGTVIDPEPIAVAPPNNSLERTRDR